MFVQFTSLLFYCRLSLIWQFPRSYIIIMYNYAVSGLAHTRNKELFTSVTTLLYLSEINCLHHILSISILIDSALSQLQIWLFFEIWISIYVREHLYKKNFSILKIFHRNFISWLTFESLPSLRAFKLFYLLK